MLYSDDTGVIFFIINYTRQIIQYMALASTFVMFYF